MRTLYFSIYLIVFGICAIIQSNVLLIEPGFAFQEIYFGYLEGLGAGGNLNTDAYLAALAVEHQAELQSNDTDFKRFSGLRWQNPLAKK